jgi:hypothetical protein
MPKGVKRINPPGMKFCTRCEETKPLEDFPKATRSHDGRFTYCRPCTKARNDERTPATRLRWRYHLSQEEWDALWAGQQGRCAICHRDPVTAGHRGLVVDHCHKTGRVRGLLCVPCNVTLARLEDETDWITAAQSYLARPA